MMRAGLDYLTRAVNCRRRVRPQPIFLPPAVYDAAKSEGVDMTQFVRQEPIPATPKR